jgi:hypothetical protein
MSNLQEKFLSDKLLKVTFLEQIFNHLFEFTENTILVSGGDEPIYLPQSETGSVNKIISTRDYFSSALHEISHWCLAGEQRRKLIDYGYWYEPDGRSEEQQRLFEQVEVKPQALEWLFTQAVGRKFSLSVDNINQPEVVASEEFKCQVAIQAQRYLVDGLPGRANLFLKALLRNYKPNAPLLDSEDFTLQKLIY